MKLDGDSTVTAPLFGVVPLFAAADLSADLGVCTCATFCLVGDVTNAFTVVSPGTDGHTGGAAAALESSSVDTYLTMFAPNVARNPRLLTLRVGGFARALQGNSIPSRKTKARPQKRPGAPVADAVNIPVL